MCEFISSPDIKEETKHIEVMETTKEICSPMRVNRSWGFPTRSDTNQAV